MKPNYFLILLFALSACSDTPSTKKNPGGGLNPQMTETQLLTNIGENVIAPAAKRLHSSTEDLRSALHNLCSAAPGAKETSLGIARAAWKNAMNAHHAMEAMPIGPLLERGRIIVDNLYSWPYTNTCGIDLQVVEMSKTGQGGRALMTNVKGLAAIEYLLFENTLGTTCNVNSISSQPAIEWTQKNPQEKFADRCEFAKFISDDIVKYAGELSAAWDPAQGNYTDKFVNGSTYSSAKEAVNAISNALFSVEKLKDERMAKPLGLHKDCTDPSKKCLNLVEHPWSGFALPAMEAQARFFLEVFTGGNGVGFDDYLAKAGQPKVAEDIIGFTNRFLANINAAQARGTFTEQIVQMKTQECSVSSSTTRTVEICAVYQDLRAVTTKMKGDFLIALSLKAPPSYQGDND